MTYGPLLGSVRAELKDFQWLTVQHVASHFFHKGRSRFLVADEVGLGKTFVARGVIASQIDHLRHKGRRTTNVIYVCSNAEIARQNIERLNILGAEAIKFTSRITLLPIELGKVTSSSVKLISFTPGTSFRLSGGLGIADERVELYWLLQRAWPEMRSQALRRGMRRLLQGGVKSARRFRERIRRMDPESLDKRIAERFVSTLRQHDKDRDPDNKLQARFIEAAEWCAARRDGDEAPHRDRSKIVGELRWLLARACIAAVPADLIILDEFQRYRDLLDPGTEAGALAHQLFDRPSIKILLLSATPYKSFRLAEEVTAGQHHYSDFFAVQRFLLGEVATLELRTELSEFNAALLRSKDGQSQSFARAARFKERIERRLSRVMLRTERPRRVSRGDEFLREFSPSLIPTSADLSAFVELDAVARRLAAGDVVEYWKAAPYLLNFMEDYKLKRAFVAGLRQGKSRDLLRLLRYRRSVLDFGAIGAYQELDFANAKLRDLSNAVIASNAWRLLWIPPALPYYQPSPPFDGPTVRRLTKRLVFSAWNVAPKALASLLSYEAERRLMTKDGRRRLRNTVQARRLIRPLLRFHVAQGRETGMAALTLLYPSPTLAELGDPLHVARDRGDLASKELLQIVANRLHPHLRSLTASAPLNGAVDEAWYWAAPILLDRKRGDDDGWLVEADLSTIDNAEDNSSVGWTAHITRARRVTVAELGRVPADLAKVLALVAVAGPATCLLRALTRGVAGLTVKDLGRHRLAAMRGAWGFRNLYNLPEVTRLLRPERARAIPYWQLALRYGLAGNLQSMLDEYIHLVREGLGANVRPVDTSDDVITKLREAIGVRTASYGLDRVPLQHEGPARTMRGRYALRYKPDDQPRRRTTRSAATDNELDVTRPGQVRDAFNSPFWPFVLATTSVGQEGLDFHYYCHAIVHWNLPVNPVDLEQREGRIQRYKGHAVRRNVAERHRDAGVNTDGDPWDAMFGAAVASRPSMASDLVPYWVYPIKSGAQIERHVPILGLSRERAALAQLKRMVAAYRVVMGQPRQDDLLLYLLANMTDQQVQERLVSLAIDLSPKGSKARQARVPDAQNSAS